MRRRVITAAKSAYQYPLIIKQLWHAPLLQAADQEIVHAEAGFRTIEELEAERDEVLLGLIELRTRGCR
jgi:fatty-acyl-CoA synthase